MHPTPSPTRSIRLAFTAALAVTAIALGVFSFVRPISAAVTVTAVKPPTVVEVASPSAPDASELAQPAVAADDARLALAPEAVEVIRAPEPDPAAPDPNVPATVVSAPTPTPTTEPPPIDDLAAPMPECGDDFSRGRWTSLGAGSSATVTSLSVDMDGSCETVTATLEGTAPDVDVTRVSYLNWTTVRFATAEAVNMPAPDLTVTAGDVITGAVPFVDNAGAGIFITHPIGVEMAANVIVDDSTVTIEFRESTPEDTIAEDGWGGEPYSLGLDGLPHDGLVVLLATELEASGEIGIFGYARSPEAHVSIRIWDGETLVDEATVVTEGPAYTYGRYHHNAFVPNGSYTVEVGWDSPSGMAEFDVWHSSQVEVIGNP